MSEEQSGNEDDWDEADTDDDKDELATPDKSPIHSLHTIEH